MGKFKLPIFLLILLGISVNNLKGQTTAYSNWYKVYNDTLQGINMEKPYTFYKKKAKTPPANHRGYHRFGYRYDLYRSNTRTLV